MAEAASASQSPSWLTERRRRGASLARELALPGPQAQGLGVHRPRAASTSTRSTPGDRRRSRASRRRRTAAARSSCRSPRRLERHRELVRERLGSIVPAEDPFVARNEARWRDGVLVYVPAGERLAEPLRLTVGAGDGEASRLADADRARGGRRGRGLGALRLASGEAPVQRGGRARRSATAPPCATSASRSSRERSWVFATQRAEVERDASLDWVALGFGSARGKVRMETKLAGRGLERQGHRRLRRRGRAAPRLRHHPGARRRGHHLRPRLPRRARRARDGGLARDDPRRPRRPAAPTPSRRAATCCSPPTPTPTRSPGSRSRPTTSAAPTPRRSPRSIPSSSSTCARTASPTARRSGW